MLNQYTHIFIKVLNFFISLPKNSVSNNKIAKIYKNKSKTMILQF